MISRCAGGRGGPTARRGAPAARSTRYRSGRSAAARDHRGEHHHGRRRPGTTHDLEGAREGYGRTPVERRSVSVPWRSASWSGSRSGRIEAGSGADRRRADARAERVLERLVGEVALRFLRQQVVHEAPGGFLVLAGLEDGDARHIDEAHRRRHCLRKCVARPKPDPNWDMKRGT